MNTVAIIPARGGSKGIPRKNMRFVAGESLVGRAVNTARTAESVDGVFVSTDDSEIATESRAHGAEVIERPRELSGDEASSESVLLHGLRHLRDEESCVPDELAFVQCTSPLLLPEDIDGAVGKLRKNGADVVFSAAPFHGFLWRFSGETLKGINHDASRRMRRQDRETQYVETGAVYVIQTDGFIEHEHRFFGEVIPYEVPPEHSIDIDRPIDLDIAEKLLRKRKRNSQLEQLPDRPAALVLDFDGVFTDNKVHVQQGGREMVVCHRGDGWGLARLKEKGLPVWVLSTEKNQVVQARCEKLDLPCVHGTEDKEAILRGWLNEEEIDAQDIVFLGNDVNDVHCLRLAGCGAVVEDAHPDVFSAANLVLSTSGGEGAVREITDLIQEKLSIS
ncbi:N-acylneuraminate cytidylyltransferase [Salinibacter ruber]|uniref:acylneuraminate cytidylyltransferase n=1 Tax=Salinibacter ruber TaxID=146919 RepID=UPI0021676991|nr:acylneuraminate cytidylyltransferase [Salinibacter ruber]MCS3830030.1 N-acylneuraminate cytidylyltransferase [Salinibacter ruber]